MWCIFIDQDWGGCAGVQLFACPQDRVFAENRRRHCVQSADNPITALARLYTARKDQTTRDSDRDRSWPVTQVAALTTSVGWNECGKDGVELERSREQCELSP
jgi:hypothetical protein